MLCEALGDAFADGRLRSDEYRERLDHASSIATLGEVQGLIGDLIAPPRPGQLAAPWGMVVDPNRGTVTRRIAFGATAIFAVFFSVLWLFSGAGFYWPVFPIVSIALAAGLLTLIAENAYERPGGLRRRRPGELEN